MIQVLSHKKKRFILYTGVKRPPRCSKWKSKVQNVVHGALDDLSVTRVEMRIHTFQTEMKSKPKTNNGYQIGEEKGRMEAMFL